MVHKMKNKGTTGGDYIWQILFVIVTITYLGAFYVIFIAGSTVDVEGFERTQGRLQSSAAHTRLLSHPDFISTGEIGVFDESLLNSKNGTEKLEELYNPSLWIYVEIENMENDDKYIFGTPGPLKATEGWLTEDGNMDTWEDEEMSSWDHVVGRYSTLVNIDTGDGFDLAKLYLYFRQIPDPMIKLKEGIHIAREEGSHTVTLLHPIAICWEYDYTLSGRYCSEDEDSFSIDVSHSDKIKGSFGGYMHLKDVELKAFNEEEEKFEIDPPGRFTDGKIDIELAHTGGKTVEYEIVDRW